MTVWVWVEEGACLSPILVAVLLGPSLNATLGNLTLSLSKGGPGVGQLNADVAVPDVRVGLHPGLEVGDEGRVLLDVDLDAAVAQEWLVAAEVGGVADDDAGEAELDDGAGAHHAGAEGRVERALRPAAEQPGLAEAIRLAMQNDRPLLLAAIAVVVSTLLVVRQSLEARTAWVEFDTGAVAKSAVLNELHGALGFGGLIHDFKNYVLHGDFADLLRVRQELWDIRAAIDSYTALGTTSVEAAAFFE